jgi:GDP-L-fucose synthase
MKILLTGSNGMVGKNILDHPHASKFEFLTPSRSILNLLDQASVNSFLIEHKPDMIIHAAGKVGGIQVNMINPVAFLVENTQMGLNLINEAYQQGISKFMNMSSSCMYPRCATNPLAEDLILQGELEPTNEGYALAKITSTRLCEYIMRENLDYLYKTVIPCNLYGRYDKFDPAYSHMIPAVIKKIYDAKSNQLDFVDIWGDGLARREFMYVGDLADFVFYAIDHYSEMPQNINVGLGQDFTINEYYKVIADVIGFEGKFTHDLSKPVGMRQKLIDDTKLRAFGWQHKTDLYEGIDKTVRFYKENSK